MPKEELLFKPSLLVLILSLFFSNLCFAGIYNQSRFKYNSQIQAGPLCYYLDYQERENGTVLDKDYGFLYGIHGKLEAKNKKFIFDIKTFIAYTDSATYEGSSSSGETISFDSEKECIITLQADAGYSVNIGIKVTPYVGIGYRLWRRGEAKVVQADDGSYVWDYKEIYSWAYIAPGIRLCMPIRNNISISLDAAYMFAIDPQVTAYFSEIDPAYSDVTLNLSPESAFYVNLPLKIRLSKRLSLHCEAIFRYWNMGRSNFYLGMYEPHSVTKIYGINVGLGYEF